MKFHVHGRESCGSVSICLETEFDDMGMQDLTLRRRFEDGACFEERRESETLRRVGSRVELGIDMKSFSV